MEIGFIVSDIIVTGPKRGSYAVYIPKSTDTPSAHTDYTGPGINYGNLSLSEIATAKKMVRYCFPIMKLQTGGQMPYDEESGLISDTEMNRDINSDTVTNFYGNTQSSVTDLTYPEGEGMSYSMRHSHGGEESMSTLFTLEVRGGNIVNTRPNAERGDFQKLSFMTKVIVDGDYIIGQLPSNNNNILYQMPDLAQEY